VRAELRRNLASQELGRMVQIAYTSDLLRLLRLARKAKPKQQVTHRNVNNRFLHATCYLITRSALASTFGGISTRYYPTIACLNLQTEHDINGTMSRPFLPGGGSRFYAHG
jgi:hypothetical protein